MKTAAQAAANWAASAGRAQTQWQEGVNGYNGDWVGATTRQENVMLTNLTQSVTSGKWRRGVEATTTQGWKNKTISKAANFGVGFQAGAPNQAAASTKIMNALASIVPSLPPRGTFEQNKIRSTSLMDQLHALNGQLGAK